MAIPGLSGARKVMEIKTGSGGDFLVIGMEGNEELGRLSEYRVQMVGELNMLGEPKDVEFDALIGTKATVSMKIDDDHPRYFNGLITRMQQGDRMGRFESYTATLKPWLWFATRTVNSKVFQKKSVKEIVSDVLDVYSTDYEWRLISASLYPKLDYCIQYQESDFDFVSRLLEHFGIYYFFEHTDSKHTMVLIDAMAKHKSKPIKDPVSWANVMKYSWTAINWRAGQEARSAKTVVRDFDYLAPTTEIKGEGTSKATTAKLGKAEVFEYTGKAVQNSIKDEAQAQPVTDAAKQRAKILMEELTSLAETSTGTTNAYDVTVGTTFKLSNHPNSKKNVNYLVVSAVYRLEFADHEAVDDLKRSRKGNGFMCDFVVTSMSAGDFRSARKTPRPRIYGPQTATVVGASANEIETDKHGRIKVQFHWDRLGTNDENSSCWVRVSQPWAGKGYGMFALPRKGHEVVVHFLDGDPDYPLVTGSVYNNDNMPAWKLPDQATVSGVKTQSSKEGTAKLANELRFDDKKDKEYIWFHAEKDFHRLVEHDAFDWVGNNESVKVVMTRKEVIGENWFMDITKDVMHNMGKDLHVKVAGDIFYTGAATYQLKLDKDFNAKIGADLGLDVGGKTHIKSKDDIVLESSSGKLSLKAGSSGDLLAEGMTIKIKGATTIAIEAGTQLSLKAGSSFVDIGPAGVSIVGSMVMINSGGAAGAAGPALAASPVAPTDAKMEDSITSKKKTDYNKTFDDPMADDMGGSGPAKES
ncbi:MAG: type VI secretion system tip protein TssI/VgrG [Caldimonas sp.]